MLSLIFKLNHILSIHIANFDRFSYIFYIFIILKILFTLQIFMKYIKFYNDFINSQFNNYIELCFRNLYGWKLTFVFLLF